MFINAINNYKPFTLNFKSNPERERELRELRRLEELKRKEEEARQKLAKDVIERQKQYDINNQISKELAGFLTGFVCAIQNDSEHDIQEFFAPEETASQLRTKLSPKCQQDSISLRNKLNEFSEITDPVQTLICANNLNRYTPKPGILTSEQYAKIVDGLKQSVSSLIRKSDLTKYTTENKNAILQMVQQIESSGTLDFRIEDKLAALIARLNSTTTQDIRQAVQRTVEHNKWTV